MQPTKRNDHSMNQREKVVKSTRVASGRKSSRTTTSSREAHSNRTSRIGLRVSPIREQTIRLASEIKDKSLSEFILDAAFQEAEQTILEQRLFQVANDKLESFLDLLDRPPMDNEGLKKLFSKPSPWDE